MNTLTPEEIERQRRVFEARARIREGITTMEAVNQLMRQVAAKRGQAAADQLRADMRHQYKTRGQWMVSGQDNTP